MSIELVLERMAGDARGPGARIAAHLPTLFMLASGAGTVVELGVGRGNSTIALLAGLEASNFGRLFSYDRDGRCGMLELPDHLAKRWIFRQSLSVTGRLDHEKDTVDLLFIDTDHTHHTTTAELECWSDRIAPGGVICGHDYTPHELAPHRAVDIAVEHFLAANPGRFTLQVMEYEQGLFLLRDTRRKV